MRLSAIYIDEHEHLFDNPQTVNFGGEYYYDFEREDKSIIVKRTVNKAFINSFFDLTTLATKVTLVNAIVGQNGAGKSSLLDIIRSNFINNKYGVSYSNAVFVYETDNIEKPLIISEEFRKVYLEEKVKNKLKRVELNSVQKNHVRTIYYSPHFDYKYNPNFDDIDNHDLSFDKLMDEDLENLNEKDKSTSGLSFSPAQELLFKNSLRQIEFLRSDLITKNKIFKELFELQNHNEPILIIRGYADEKDYHNDTPYEFIGPLKEINKKLEDEGKNWHKQRKFNGTEVTNQVEINRYSLKRNFLKVVLSLLHTQMERSNLYLEEGRFPQDEFNIKKENLDAYNSLLFFIENAAIDGKNGKLNWFLKKGSLPKLIAKFFEAVDSTANVDDVKNDSLKTSSEKTIEILHLQRLFLSEINRYYHLFSKEDKAIPRNEQMEGVINYMPFSRRLSSGENALLNLFSRLYNFIAHNFINNTFFELSQHYILLLDEADLSFHPSWKKRYVKALLKTLPYFFNELANHPSIQIIFTTHDPLTLSDLPNSNVVYLERRTYSDKTKILGNDDENRPTKTFGANISDLLADSFFIETSLVGDFAFNKIQDAIKWLNNADNKENTEYYEKLIYSIDEPIVQRKLSEMFDEKMQTQVQLKLIDEQIGALQVRREKLKKN